MEAVLRVCFFAEKHGKGLVDAFFAIVKGWLWDYMLTPNVVLKDGQKVFSTLLADAKIAHARDPGGPEYVVETQLGSLHRCGTKRRPSQATDSSSQPG